MWLKVVLFPQLTTKPPIVPVSSLVSAILIWIAFNVEAISFMWDWVVNGASGTLKAWTGGWAGGGKGGTRAYGGMSCAAKEPSDLETVVVDEIKRV